MEGAVPVGGFEGAAEGAGEDGERAGDGEQQHGAGVMRGGAAEVPGAEQRGEPAPGGGEPRGDPHQRGEEAQHGEADDGHQHGGGDDGEPLEAGVADERSVDRAAGELQLEDEQRAERDDRDINEDALAPGVGCAAAFAAGRDDRLAGRAIGGDGLGDERERAGAERDVPGEGGQTDGQQAAAEGFVERRHEAEQRDETHPDQGAEHDGREGEDGGFDDVEQRDIAAPRAAAAQPGGVFGALLGEHRGGDHGVDEDRADELQHDHHQGALGELEAVAEAHERARERGALREAGQLLGEPGLHDFEAIAGGLGGLGAELGGVEPIALEQGEAERRRLVGETAEDVFAAGPEAQLGVAGGDRQEADIERRPAADVGGRVEDADDDDAALGRRAEPEGLGDDLVADGEAEGPRLPALEGDLDHAVGAGGLGQPAGGELGALFEVGLRGECAVQALGFFQRLRGGADDVTAGAEGGGLIDQQAARGFDRLSAERTLDLADGLLGGCEAGLDEAQVHLGGVGVAEQLAQAEVADRLDEDRRGGGEADGEQGADQQDGGEPGRGHDAAQAQADDFGDETTAHLSPPNRGAATKRRGLRPNAPRASRRRVRSRRARRCRARRRPSRRRRTSAGRRGHPRR